MKNDLTNIRFGKLVAKSVCGKSKDRHCLWVCDCDCGNTIVVPSNRLVCGHTQSCGCLQKENTSTARKKHGASGNHQNIERLYRVWSSMRARCNNPKDKEYKFYGGKGITVCNEWNDYKTFKAWAISNGYNAEAKYGECTIDRIDESDGYSPQNCRWVNMKVQNRYKQKPVIGFFDDGTVKEYESIADAERSTNALRQNISQVLHGKAKKAGGAIWKFKEAM